MMSTLITAGLLVLCVVSSGLIGNLYKALSNKSKNAAVSTALPMVWFLLLSLVFLAAAFITKEPFQRECVMWAVFGGVCLAVAVTILIESMKTNALSIAIIIVNLNFIITILFSIWFIPGEQASVVPLVGMMLSALIIIIMNKNGNQEGNHEKKGSSVWPLVMASIANGLLNFFMKMNTAKTTMVVNGKETSCVFWYFVILYGSGAVACFLASTFMNLAKGQNGFPLDAKTVKSVWVPTLLFGVCEGVCFYASLLLTERINATAQFTIITCGAILFSLIVGMIFQGEKFTKKTAISMVFCLIAILCQGYSDVIHMVSRIFA